MMSGVETPSIPPEIQRKLDLLDAMTPEELANPTALLKGGGFKQKKAIASRCGQEVQSVNRLVRIFFLFLFCLVVCVLTLFTGYQTVE